MARQPTRLRSKQHEPALHHPPSASRRSAGSPLRNVRQGRRDMRPWSPVVLRREAVPPCWLFPERPEGWRMTRTDFAHAPPAKRSDVHRQRRAAALASGAKTFDGDACIYGHRGLRFASNGYCVECAREVLRRRPRLGRPAQEAAAAARAEARDAGLARFSGAPCKQCGGVLRYTCNNRCVPCGHQSARKQAAKPASRERAAKAKASREATPEAKARRTAKACERYARDPTFRLAVRMRSAVHKALRRHMKDKARRSWQELVGYSVGDLRTHLERQFLKGMSWENADRWHVDHILPVASFGAVEPGDAAFRACWALTNLRPLWKSDNHRKGARREHLL